MDVVHARCAGLDISKRRPPHHREITARGGDFQLATATWPLTESDRDGLAKVFPRHGDNAGLHDPQMAVPMIRLLIADDHEVIRFGLRMLLRGEPDITVVGEAADGRTAVTMVAFNPPDLVLMDLSMPVLDGIAATREIVTATPSVQVLILTANAREASVRKAFDAGASGYVLKHSPPDTLLKAIRSLFSNRSSLSPQVWGLYAAGSSAERTRSTPRPLNTPRD